MKRVKGDYMKDPAFALDNIKNISTAGAGAALVMCLLQVPPPASAPPRSPPT